MARIARASLIALVALASMPLSVNAGSLLANFDDGSLNAVLDRPIRPILAPTLIGTVRNDANDPQTDSALGFDSFSSTGFAVLGDLAGDLTSFSASPSAGLSRLAYSITLSEVSDLLVRFDYRFRGWDSSVAGDRFFVGLLGPSGDFFSLLRVSTSLGGGPFDPVTFGEGVEVERILVGLPPGTYQLLFGLDENDTAGPVFGQLSNTGVALDDVLAVWVPSASVPEPGAAALLVCGLTGLVRMGRRPRARIS